MKMNSANSGRLTSRAPVATSSPAVKSMESPGRKKPTSNPVSANTMPQISRIAQGPSAGSRRKTSGFNQSGRKLADTGLTATAASAACMFRSGITEQTLRHRAGPPAGLPANGTGLPADSRFCPGTSDGGPHRARESLPATTLESHASSNRRSRPGWQRPWRPSIRPRRFHRPLPLCHFPRPEPRAPGGGAVPVSHPAARCPSARTALFPNLEWGTKNPGNPTVSGVFPCVAAPGLDPGTSRL